MKANDLKSIMTTAWRFFRITGESFSECLRKAWANFKLVAAMRTRIVKFYFQKVDGSVREAYGTLRPDLLPEIKGADQKRNDTVEVYFDTEKQAWRSYKKMNLVAAC